MGTTTTTTTTAVLLRGIGSIFNLHRPIQPSSRSVPWVTCSGHTNNLGFKHCPELAALAALGITREDTEVESNS